MGWYWIKGGEGVIVSEGLVEGRGVIGGGGGKGGDCGKEADRCQKEKVCSFARFELSIVHLLELDLELYTFCSTRP